MIRRFVFFLSLIAVPLCASGCAGGISDFIVQQRNAQGDTALDHGNLTDAQLAYRLAVQVDPQDAHARAGLAAVQLKIAAELFTESKIEDALAALAVAAKYDPDSVRLAELRSEIEEARVKREIVVSNYPTYKETGRALRRSYTQLKTQTGAIVAALQRFDYTYDSDNLTTAIRSAYELNADVTRLTARLVSYRQLVESGAPERAADAPLAPAASLLPLP
jgi:tetratricopeptide (TPR) repeat protein